VLVDIIISWFDNFLVQKKALVALFSEALLRQFTSAFYFLEGTQTPCQF
jgi:hypothetical protein